MIMTGLFLWYKHNNKNNNLSDIISDTDSVISSLSDTESTLSDTTLTPSNINEINLSHSYNTGDLIFYSANKNHLGIKNK